MNTLKCYLYDDCNYYTVPTSQSEVTVTQLDDSQTRQTDESSQVKHTNGLYVCEILLLCMCTLK